MRTYYIINALRLFCLIVLTAGPYIAKCQQVIGIPVSFTHPEIFTPKFLKDSIPPYKLPVLNNKALQAYADSVDQNCIPCKYTKHYGYGIDNTLDLKRSAQYYNPSISGGQLWIMRISSKNALGLQFYFSQFDLPMNTFLHIYTADKTKRLGPYTSLHKVDTPIAVQFGTIPIFSNDVYLEYFESDSADTTGTLRFANMIHLFSDVTPGESADCQQDIACSPPERCMDKSVALMLSYNSQNQLASTCTGTLLNNTSVNGIPYFLTASHCIPSIASPYIYNMQFAFDYQKEDCSGDDPDPLFQKVIYGATSIVSQDNFLDGCETPGHSDYCLLKLMSSLSDITTLNLCYAGWTIEEWPEATDNFTIVHHPKSDLKKVSYGTNLVVQINDIPSQCSSSHLEADYYFGLDINSGASPEHGSSGAPLFNGLGKVIGTVTTGVPTPNYTEVDPCNPASYSLYFGRFSQHWSFGNFASALDPSGLISESAPSWHCYCPAPAPPPSGGCDHNYTVGDGIRINGQDSLAIICPTDEILITPLEENIPDNCFFIGSDFFQEIDCDHFDEYNATQNCYDYTHWFKRHCYCQYFSYEIFVGELDYALNPTANSWHKVYNMKLPMPGISFPFHPSDMGITLQPGKIYNIGIGMWVGSNYQYSSRYVYILPFDLNINTATVATDLYAMHDITLQNVTVPVVDIKVAASNQIGVLPNSGLRGGHYFIRDIDCGSFFRVANTGFDPWKENAPEKLAVRPPSPSTVQQKMIAMEQDKVRVMPNPNAGIFSIKAPEHFSQASIEIRDVIGRVVYKGRYNNSKDREVDLSDMENGIYYLRISNVDGKREVVTILKE